MSAGRGRRRPARQARPKKARGASVIGREYDVEVGPIAHGGHCVARVPVSEGETRVVFVRHALPGETVRIRITEGTEGDRFWRADAVAVLEASPDRVEAPCRFAGPDLCGGCDFQHVALPAQRELKAAVVREQLARLARIDWPVEVEAVPGDVEGLGWRTRQRYVSLLGGIGMRKHRSHDVVPIDTCLLAAPEPATHEVRGRAFQVAGDGFWQVHPGAPSVLVDTVLDFLQPQAGESAMDLYAGVGLFSAFLRDAVGEGPAILAVEGDRTASELSTINTPGVEAVAGDVATVLAARDELREEHYDVVVLDPPREGAKRAVVDQVVRRTPRAVAYVACDPAALARDVAIFAEHGYTLRKLRAFDLFPMTHHVECVALLVKAPH